MKTLCRLLLLAALPLLASCAREEAAGLPAGDDSSAVRLTASFENNTTRTSLGKELSGAWSPDDRIAVHDGTAIREFSIVDFDGATATFEGEMILTDGPFHAAYPYASATACSNGSWTLTVPDAQVIAAGDSVAVGALAATARFTDPGSVPFRNVTGVLRLVIGKKGITSVTLTGNDGEALAGTVLADAATGVVTERGTATSVTLTHASGSFPKGAYYLALVPVTLSQGLTLTFLDKDGNTATKKGTSPLTVVRSGAVNLGDVTDGLSWTAPDLVIPSEDTDPDDDDIVANTTFDRRVRVVYDSSGATVIGADGLAVTVDGNHVTIDNQTKKTYIYELSGSASDGSFKLYSGKKQAIVLNGLSLTNPHGAAINNQSHKRTFVVVEGTNVLGDGPSYTETPEDEDEKAAFFSEGQLIFSGHGSLSVRASGKAGISSDDYVRFMSSPTVNVSSRAGHGIRGKEAVIVSNGVIEASVSADSKKGFCSDSLVRFTGGTTKLRITGGVANDTVDGGYTGSAGVKADRVFEMLGGALEIINNGRGGKGIKCDGTALFSGGNLAITTTGRSFEDQKDPVHPKGIRCEGALIWSGTVAHITSDNSEGLESKSTIDISGGELFIQTRDDAVNAVGVTISGGSIYAQSFIEDGIDSNGDLSIEGGLVFVVGSFPPQNALDAGTEYGYHISVSGGTLFIIGGMGKGTILTQACYQSGSWSRGVWYSMEVGDRTYAFKTPSTGGLSLIVSGNAKPQVWNGVTVSGGTSLLNGVVLLDPGRSGGTLVSLTEY